MSALEDNIAAEKGAGKCPVWAASDGESCLADYSSAAPPKVRSEPFLASVSTFVVGTHRKSIGQWQP